MSHTLPFDPGYVHAYLTAAMKEVCPDGLIDPQIAYLLQWIEEGGPDGGGAWNPESDVTKLIADGFARHGYRQGTKECIAFFRGACYAVERSAAHGVNPCDQPQQKGGA